MIYKYSPEVDARFAEVAKYQHTDFRKALEGCLQIIEDYKHDEGVLAKAYYYAAAAYILLSEEENAQKCCEKSIESGRKSGNVRCQILSMIQSTILKLNNMNDALAADTVYEALSMAIQNHDEDLLDTIYTLLAQIFEAAEDYEISIQYHRKGIEEFIKKNPDADTKYVTIYGSRILCSSVCCISLNDVESFEANYKELERILFGESMPVYGATMVFMRGYLAYMKGNRTEAVPALLEFVDRLSQLEDIMDTYELLTPIYNAFEAYELIDCQKKVVELMEHYASTIGVWKCRSQCNKLKIRYYKQIQDKDLLFEAYNEYYELEQQYHSSYMKQRRANLLLRKQVFEDLENTKYKIHTLEALSETDMLTGVANRNGLMKYVRHMLPIAVETGKEWGVLLLDIDRYKGYNDHYGHIQGDECLKKIANVFKDVMKGHFCARYGGDEFICVFMGLSKEEIVRYMEELQAQIMEMGLEHTANEPYGIVTVSQGATVSVPQKHEEFEKFVYEADIKLYQCKEKGRNAIII